MSRVEQETGNEIITPTDIVTSFDGLLSASDGRWEGADIQTETSPDYDLRHQPYHPIYQALTLSEATPASTFHTVGPQLTLIREISFAEDGTYAFNRDLITRDAHGGAHYEISVEGVVETQLYTKGADFGAMQRQLSPAQLKNLNERLTSPELELWRPGMGEKAMEFLAARTMKLKTKAKTYLRDRKK